MMKLLVLPVLAYVSVALGDEDMTFWSADIGYFKEAVGIQDERARLKAIQIQCTRRYTPGRCLDEVKPVWTYNFHLQNCTERLGCRQPTPTNRFMSYKICMDSCQSLIKIYDHILTQGSDWNETELRQQERAMRRHEDELEQSFIEAIQPEEEDEPPTRYHSQDLYLASLFEEREDPEMVALAEVLPPNIDYQAPDFIRYDPIHRPRPRL